MSEKIYAKGIFGFEKKSTQPDFVIGSLLITLSDFKEFVNSNAHLLTEYQSKQQLKLQLLKGKDGKMSIVVDTFKPEPKQQSNSQTNVGNDMPF